MDSNGLETISPEIQAAEIPSQKINQPAQTGTNQSQPSVVGASISPGNNTAEKPKSKLPFILAIIVSIILVLGVSGFFLYQVFGPGQVKEKLKVGHPVFKQYSKSVDKIADDLLEESSSFDSDSMERMAQKEQTLISEAELNLKTLNSLMESQKKVLQLSKYNSLVDKYLTISTEIVNIEKDNHTIMNGLISPTRDYEQLTLDISGGAQYIYTNPDKYVSVLKDAAAKEQLVIDKIRKINVTLPEDKEFLDVYARNLDDERKYLLDLVSAVESRNSTLLSSASQTYTRKKLDNEKDLKRIADNVKNSLKSKIDTLEDAYSDVNEEYAGLKAKYGL